MREYRYFYAERAITYSQFGQHMVLLVIRQYEGKSYRMFSEWLVEAYYLRTFLQLSHFTTLQKFTERINGTLLEKIISSFIILTKIGQLFVGIDSSGFKATHASQYYTERVKLRRKYIKLSLAANVLQQIICTIKIRRAPTRHDSMDFRPLITKISELYRYLLLQLTKDMIAKTITY